MNLFYQNSSNHFKPILFNNKMVYLQYDLLRGIVEQNFSSEYHEIIAKPFISGTNINWYSSRNTKLSPLDFLSKAEKTAVLIKFNQFLDEIQIFSNKLKESADIDKITLGSLLSQVFNRNSNIVFTDGKNLVLLWGWNFNSDEENYIPTELYKTETALITKGIEDPIDTVLSEHNHTPNSEALINTNTDNIFNSEYNKKIIVRSNKQSKGFVNYLAKGWWIVLLAILFLVALLYFIKPIDCCRIKNSYPYSDTNPPDMPSKRPPIDRNKIIKDPATGDSVISNLINIALKDKTKNLQQFAIDLKNTYPDSAYKIVYTDTTISRLQFIFPDSLRTTIKSDIKARLTNYSLLIWDESVFATNKTFNDPALSDQTKNWYFNSINANKAWDITTGNENIIVAVIDCGFDLSHPDLKKKIVHPYNVRTKDSVVFASTTLYHGTHVAGIAVANNNNGMGSTGIAPGCSLMPIQISGADGLFTSSDVIDGVLFAIKHNANVVNMSLGKIMPDQLTHAPIQDQQSFINSALKDEEDFWKEVFDYAEKQNVTIVIAAGNENAMVGLDPMQRSDIVIKVSAAEVTNRKADYSNFGPLTTICAPGSKIYNCYVNNTYQFLDGTSMASPIVAGAVALMKSINPNLKNRDIINILKSTGKPLGDNNIGSMIQIDKALEAARNIR